MRLELPASGVAAVRFGVSPLFELACLVRRLRRGAQGVIADRVWQDWRRSLAALTDRADVELVLRSAAGRHGSMIWVPGTPSMGRTFDAELAALAQLTDDQVASDLHRYAIDASDDSRLRQQVTSGLSSLWDALLRDCWPAVRSVAEHEMARTTNRLHTGGWDSVFDELSAGLSWDGAAIELTGLTATASTGAISSGLVLVPSVFVIGGPVVRLGAADPAVVFYPARGIGLLFDDGGTAPAGLAALVGVNRARIMIIIQDPTTVSRLRDLLDLSLGSISRHLTVLVNSGLAVSRRVGRSVEYQLSDVGVALLSAQQGDGS